MINLKWQIIYVPSKTFSRAIIVQSRISVFVIPMKQLPRPFDANVISSFENSNFTISGMILALTQPQLIDKLICVDATPFDSEISINRWRTLRQACRLLEKMEHQLRSVQGIERSSLADKVRFWVFPK